jgi:hypothetical protein
MYEATVIDCPVCKHLTPRKIVMDEESKVYCSQCNCMYMCLEFDTELFQCDCADIPFSQNGNRKCCYCRTTWIVYNETTDKKIIFIGNVKE